VNAFRGKIAGANAVIFRNIPLRPASGSQTMRITNLRVNASQLGAGPVPITALIQMNSTVAIPITGQLQTIANAQRSVAIQQGVATPGSDSTTQTVSLTFTEQFATAFKPAIASGQDPSVLGQIYNSESGFLNTAQFGAATGRADTATRLRARITNIPTGTCVYAAVFASAGAAAQLVSADANGAGGTFVAGSSQFGGTYQQLTCSTSTATATWEVTSSNPLSLENSSVTLLFQNAGSQISQIQIATSLAPVTQDKFAAAGSTVPVPRFIDNSVPIPILVLRATSTVTTPGTASTSRTAGLRPLALSGGIVNITDLIINDSASMAPNVVTHTNLPPSLTLASNACATPPPGTTWICDPDGHGLTILHGTVPPHTPVTFSFSATIDPGVLSGTLLQVTTNASSDLPVDPTGATSTVTFTVESSSCSAQISPSSPTQIPASGGTLSFPVSFLGTSCPPWTANANQIWITLPGGSYFTTPATVTVQAPANTGPARSAVLTIADKSVTVNQAGSSDVRDFGGNGHSGVLLYDPSNGQSYTLLSNGSATFQSVGNLFTPAFDILRTGDFNGDGKADLVVYNSHTALAYLGLGNGDGTFSFQSLFWSPGYDFVETGDLNGDGKTDFALYNSSVGTMYTAISNGSGGFTYKYTLISKGFTFVRLADFTGDGKADIFLYRATDGVAYMGVGDGSGGFAFNPLFISPGYNLADTGDLNGDGKADVILYNPANGNAATGLSNGSNGFVFTSMIFSPGFTSVRLADYTGDGKADLTVYNKVNAAAYFGTGTGTGNFNFQSLFWSPGYDWVVPEDVNGDGKMDVLLYNSSTATEYTGLSNGNGTFSYTYSYWGIGKVLAR
jgi:FG-GAP-like repeat